MFSTSMVKNKSDKAWETFFINVFEAIKVNSVNSTSITLQEVIKEHSHDILHFAVEKEDVTIINLLLDKGANINATAKANITPLYCAVYKQNVEIVNILLAKGADPNITISSTLNHATPLLLAVSKNDYNMVQALLENGADVNIPDNDTCSTPLYLAAENGNLDLVNLLLEQKNIDINRANKRCLYQLSSDKNTKTRLLDPYTPLCIAAEKGHLPIVQALLKKGAKIEPTDNKAAHPRRLAEKAGHLEIARILNSNLEKLESYIKTRSGEAEEYKRSYKFFGHVFNFGFSKDQKIAAATHLLNLVHSKNGNIGSADIQTLSKEDRAALTNGDLKYIYRRFL